MKERLSSIELLRIISMLMVVLLHSNYFTIGIVEKTDILSEPLPSFCRMFLEQVCIVAVNVFVLISGWFGISPTAKGACSLLYQVFFFGIITLVPAIVLGASIPWGSVMKVFFGGVWYWFIPSYLILYILSPVLNSFIDNSSPRSVFSVVVLFLAAEFMFGWMASLRSFCNGYSVISFIGLYLLSRYVRLYSKTIKEFGFSKDLIIFGILSLIPCIVQFFGVKFFGHEFNPRAYSSPFVIFASLFLLLGFARLNFSSKVVNWIACSVFPVYIVTLHPVVVPFFKEQMLRAYMRYGGLQYIMIAIISAIIICLVCVVIDKFRKYTWDILWKSFIERLMDRCTHLFDSFAA